jgi:fumarate reductase subunit C
VAQSLLDAVERIMNQHPGDSEYHPRWYRRRVSTYWWLGSWAYLVFILRELSSVFIGWFVVYTLLLIRAVSISEDAYVKFQAWSQLPGVVLLNVVSLSFVVLHAITWLNLAPKAMVVRMRGQRVPAMGIVAANYVAWALVSALVAWFILRR